MNDAVFQNILDSLGTVLPSKWEKVIFRADYTDGSYSMKFYVDYGNGDYIDCFKLGTPSKQQILSAFRSINKDIAVERQGLSAKEKWSVMTMAIEQSGKFKADFDYTDISKNIISYQTAWEKRYLGK